METKCRIELIKNRIKMTKISYFLGDNTHGAEMV